MRQQYRQPQGRRLRRQPRMRKVQASASVRQPQMSVPKTAKRRRLRNDRRVRVPAMAFRRFVLSARWISLGVLALCAYALVLVGLDEHFYLKEIPVEGTVSIPVGEIVEASGLAGNHVFAADPNVAASRIAGLPGVISANVTLQWPNEVSIQVEEDSPVAIWQEGSQQYWINHKGSLIPGYAGATGLLLIEYEHPPVKSDDELDNAKAAMAFVPQDVLDGALQLKALRQNIDKLYYRQSSGLSYQDGRGWRVHFGTGTDMQQKLNVYETILEELLSQQLTPTYISVSNQQKPYYLAR